MKGLRNGIVIFLSTGYCIGSVTAIILYTILPEDPDLSHAELNSEVHDIKEEPTNDDFESPVKGDLEDTMNYESDGMKYESGLPRNSIK